MSLLEQFMHRKSERYETIGRRLDSCIRKYGELAKAALAGKEGAKEHASYVSAVKGFGKALDQYASNALAKSAEEEKALAHIKGYASQLLKYCSNTMHGSGIKDTMQTAAMLTQSATQSINDVVQCMGTVYEAVNKTPLRVPEPMPLSRALSLVYAVDNDAVKQMDKHIATAANGLDVELEKARGEQARLNTYGKWNRNT